MVLHTHRGKFNPGWTTQLGCLSIQTPAIVCVNVEEPIITRVVEFRRLQVRLVYYRCALEVLLADKSFPSCALMELSS